MTDTVPDRFLIAIGKAESALRFRASSDELTKAARDELMAIASDLSLLESIMVHQRLSFHRQVFAAVFADRVVQSLTETRVQVARWSWTTATIAVDEYERLAKERTP